MDKSKESIILDDIPTHARIGLLALASDFCLEDHLRLMLPTGYQIFTNRVSNQMPLNRENLCAMEADIGRAAKALLPGGRPHCFIYGCTSGTAAIGYDNIVRHIQQAVRRDVPVITPLSASFDGLRALGVKKISLVTPYNQSLSKDVAHSFQQAGFDVVRHCYLEMMDDYDIYRVSLKTLAAVSRQAFSDDAEALFISCTSTRASLIINTLEAELGIPVLTSNQCLAYGTMVELQQHGSIARPKISGFGRLLRTL